MTIPANISKDHLLKATEKIDQEGIPSDGDSQYYNAEFNGKLYPPKLVVSYANIFANGEILDRRTFRGGLDTPCFQLLKENDFQIVHKNGTPMSNGEKFYPELISFLEQSETKNLKTKHFKRTFKGLKVKVSFGQGVSARIPWISFLMAPHSTSEGIYPGYLYYKDINRLILSYGISETNEPPMNWQLSSNQKTIKQFFKENNYGHPTRYGDSYVFKVYNTLNLPEAEIIESDLHEIIEIYKALNSKKEIKVDDNLKMKRLNKTEKTPLRTATFLKDAKTSGLQFSKKLIDRFVASLCTKPFVILTGLSGSGKTKLAQTFAQWICGDDDQYCIVPVGADWTNKEPLLGYPNALDDKDYVNPENGVLNLVKGAMTNTDLPYFLILDEMNLSHVERYFAEFLSAMESQEEISLHNGVQEKNGVPPKIMLPSNLFIIGTVNIDETTYMFSPKVLDRANTIEFRVSATELEDFFNDFTPLNLNELKGHGANMAQSFLEVSRNKKAGFDENLKATLLKFFNELKKTGAEFGYRTASEISTLYYQLQTINDRLTEDEKLDIAIMQKLLPKLHGSRRKLCPVLITLGSFCVEKELNIETEVFDISDFDLSSEVVKYPLSLEKIKRMYKGAIDHGFASYAEA
ncbi:MrcB family domain-containing protein [Salegentibacter agarivorans]